MSKIELVKELELIEKENDFLLTKAEEERLDVMVQELPSKEQVADRFGSFNEYLKALVKYKHPRHNEAMEIRNLRCLPRDVLLESSGALRRIEDKYDVINPSRTLTYDDY